MLICNKTTYICKKLRSIFCTDKSIVRCPNPRNKTLLAPMPELNILSLHSEKYFCHEFESPVNNILRSTEAKRHKFASSKASIPMERDRKKLTLKFQLFRSIIFRGEKIKLKCLQFPSLKHETIYKSSHKVSSTEILNNKNMKIHFR